MGNRPARKGDTKRAAPSIADPLHRSSQTVHWAICHANVRRLAALYMDSSSSLPPCLPPRLQKWLIQRGSRRLTWPRDVPNFLLSGAHGRGPVLRGPVVTVADAGAHARAVRDELGSVPRRTVLINASRRTLHQHWRHRLDDDSETECGTQTTQTPQRVSYGDSECWSRVSDGLMFTLCSSLKFRAVTPPIKRLMTGRRPVAPNHKSAMGLQLVKWRAGEDETGHRYVIVGAK